MGREGRVDYGAWERKEKEKKRKIILLLIITLRLIFGTLVGINTI